MDQLSALSGPELVFGLVGALGSDLKAVTRTLISELERVRYKVEEIHVSALLHQLDRYAHLGNGGFDSEYERIREHMKAGTDLRSETAAGEAMALLAIAAIRQRRITRQPSRSHEDAANRPLERTAFVIRSLKHPDEIGTQIQESVGVRSLRTCGDVSPLGGGASRHQRRECQHV